MNGPLLVTARFELWQPAPSDVVGLFELTRSEESRRFLGGFIPSQADSFARLLRNAGSWALWGYGTFLIRPRGHQQIVANCGIFRSFRGFGAEHGMDDIPEAGWIVHPDWWARGVASEAMTAALNWFDQTQGHQRVAAMIEQGHDASEAIAARLGFERYGTYTSTDHTPLGLWQRLQ